MLIQKLNQKPKEELNEIQVNKVLPLFLFLFLITSCSLDQKSGIWSKPDKIENDKDFVIVELFKEEKKLDNELNSKVRIQ